MLNNAKERNKWKVTVTIRYYRHYLLIPSKYQDGIYQPVAYSLPFLQMETRQRNYGMVCFRGVVLILSLIHI